MVKRKKYRAKQKNFAENDKKFADKRAGEVQKLKEEELSKVPVYAKAKPKGFSAEYLHKQASYVEEHIKEVEQERIDSWNEAEQEKARLRTEHFDNLALQQKAHDEQASLDAFRQQLHKESVQDKVTMAQKMRKYKAQKTL